MVFRYEYQGGVWIDLERPSEEEIREIAQEFSISERIEKELLFPTPTPLVANDTDAALLVLHFPAHGAENNETGKQEIDFVVGGHFIITVQYEVVAPLHNLKKLFETQKLVSPHTLITADMLFEILFVHLYTSVRDNINHVMDNLTHVERDMFNGSERTTIRSISNISREFLHMEAALADQEGPLSRFLQVLAQHDFFNISFAERIEHILAEHSQVSRVVRTHRAVAGELRETNIALLEASQNEIMKTLTIITVIVLPLELIAVVFGMHVQSAPLGNNPNGFLIIMGLMFGTTMIMLIYFARKRWLF